MSRDLFVREKWLQMTAPSIVGVVLNIDDLPFATWWNWTDLPFFEFFSIVFVFLSLVLLVNLPWLKGFQEKLWIIRRHQF